MRVLKGKVVTGAGNFSLWIEKLRDHYRHVACEVKLREQHQLRDGDVVEVVVAV